MAEFAMMCAAEYGLINKTITARNPQANAIVERVHQTLGNMLRTMEIYKQDLDKEDPFSGILAATMFAVRSTVSTTTRATPSQLVFGRDAIFNIPFKANWDFIKQRKQEIINKNNKKENSKRLDYEYKIGQKILVETYSKTKFGQAEYVGPYPIVTINNNGTLRYKKGLITDVVNLRKAVPYEE